MLAIATAVIAFTGIGTTMALGQAQAATASPGSVISAAQTVTFRICLLNADTLCLASNGAGNQVTIKSSDYAVFHFADTADNGQEYQLENAAGNCLRAGDNNVVKLQNGPCVSTFANDWWKTGSASRYQVVSVGRGQEMYTPGDQNGRDVWWGPFQSGQWWQWAAFA